MNPSESNQLYRFQEFRLDPVERLLRRNGHEIPLTPTLYDLLLFLVENSGHILVKEQLMEKVWEGRFVEEGNLTRSISNLRSILGDDSSDPRLIETIPRRGYRFIAEVTTDTAQEIGQVLPRPPLKVETNVDERVPVRRSRRAIAAALLAVALAGGVAAILYIEVFRDSPARSPVTIKSLAVLPLENLSGDPAQEYFADGMTEALITSLAQIRALRVISRTSAMQYKGSRKPLPEIARDLKVDAVITGSAQRAGGRVKVTARLVHGATDRHLWAQSYDRELSDVLKLQSEVAGAVADEIRIKVGAEEQVRLASARQVSPEAHEAYLLGRYYWNKRSAEALKKGIEYFQRALDVDPNYASAYAGLANCYGVLGGIGDPREFLPLAEANAARALEIDQSLAEARAIMAGLRAFYYRDPSGAERQYRQAIDLNPGFATAHQRYSYLLAALGRVEESMAQIKQALALDPISLSINTSLGNRLYLARRYDEAIQQLVKALEMDPNFLLAHIQLGQVYGQKGMHAEAIAQLREAAKLSREYALPFLGYAYAVAGQTSEAQRVLGELREVSQRRYVSPVRVAEIHVGLKETNQAFAWLQKADQGRAFHLIFLLVDPIWDPLRSDPRWKTLLQGMNFPDVPSGR